MWDEKRRKMTDRLVGSGHLKSPEIIESFKRVPRHKFVPPDVREGAYIDRPLPIGHGQTISAPSMIAIMLEVLQVKGKQKVLEIGAGSGYNAALIAEIIGRDGELYTIERIEKIAKFGNKNLEESGYDWVNVIVGDGTRGYEEKAPWDRILVTACAPEVPKPLIEQLKVGGKLAAPVGKHPMSQTLILLKKLGEGKTEVERHGGCSFVPLVGEYGWDEERAP